MSEAGSIDFTVREIVGTLPKNKQPEIRVINIVEVMLPFSILAAILCFTLFLLLLEICYSYATTKTKPEVNEAWTTWQPDLPKARQRIARMQKPKMIYMD